MYQSLVSPIFRCARVLREFAPAVLAALTLGLAVEPALAELPQVVVPAGAADGDFIAVVKAYAQPALVLIGLLIAALIFYVVAAGAITKFNDYRIGKGELGTVATYIVTGGMLIILIVYLVDKASTVLGTGSTTV